MLNDTTVLEKAPSYMAVSQPGAGQGLFRMLAHDEFNRQSTTQNLEEPADPASAQS